MLKLELSMRVAVALGAVALCAAGFSQTAHPGMPAVVLVLSDGSQLAGALSDQDATQVTIATASIGTVHVDKTKIVSCAMTAVGATPYIIAAKTPIVCTAAIPAIHSGFVQATISVGYIGSAQRDESAKASVTFADYQGLERETGSFRGKTNLALSVAYDDKWKATPLSSNVTQDYAGLLTENIFLRRTPNVKCSSDGYPAAILLTGSAYHNNSQGIQVDQSYGFGVKKSYAFGGSNAGAAAGCQRSPVIYTQRLELSADIRSVNYQLYSPGKNVHGVGSQLGIGYSRVFPSKQVLGFTLAGVPVFNNADMWQASGNVEYFIPITKSLSLTPSVSDNYYEIAPKTFNKNYVNLAIGLKFAPVKK